MAQLNRFLAAMTEYKAEALVLKQDQSPSFRFVSGDKPVSKQVLDTERILALISELAERPVDQELKASGSTTFECTADGNSYSGTIENEGGQLVATICEVLRENGESTPAAGAVPSPPADSVHDESNEAESVGHVPAPPKDAVLDDRSGIVPTVGGQKHEVSGSSPAGMPTVGEVQLQFQVPDDLPSEYRQRIEALLREMVERGASDLHLCCKHGPVFRIDGHVEEDKSRPPIDADELFRMLFSITPARNREQFLGTHDTDFAYAIPELSRYRANLFFDRFGPGAVFRAVPNDIISAADLGLTAEVQALATLNKGLVLVTGPTGSGKSTTLAALLDLVNRNRSDHIITIEDPVEFVHPTKKCLVNQREVGVHTKGFKAALRAALREDPDVILVGELRDLETVEMAIETAETGHLVFGTLHTTTAASTVDRIIDQFPADRQSQIRVMLSESLRGVISQTLLPKMGGGRIAAHEILMSNPSVSNLIREGKTFQIESQMQTGRKKGMQTLNMALLELVTSKKVTPQDAWMKAIDREGLKDIFDRNGVNTSSLVG